MAKTAVIIDIACPFDNRYQALQAKRVEKTTKYAHLAKHLQERGFDTATDAILVGALGTWDPANEGALNMLRVPAAARAKLRRLAVSDVLRWSRDIYVEHVSGVRQYKEAVTLPA